MNAIAPIARVPVTTRTATPADIPFIDHLQKMHGKMVGWMPTSALEGKIKLGHVLIAEESAAPVGYCIGNDQYFKRDDVGVIYQLNVLPMKHRSLIGATLIKAMFDRAAYGCKLFCCWCTQDIDANYFWESLGFVPLAFRAGSRKKARVHIFWQRRIRAGDDTTPYWFPSQTSSGSIREDRIVLPIPPGTHWRDAKPLILPGADEPKQIDGPAPKRTKAKTLALPKTMEIRQGGLRFTPEEPLPVKREKPKQEKREKQKNDPKLVAAARELRDRWLEQVNSSPLISQGKYDVGRQISVEVRTPAALPAPIAA